MEVGRYLHYSKLRRFRVSATIPDKSRNATVEVRERDRKKSRTQPQNPQRRKPRILKRIENRPGPGATSL